MLARRAGDSEHVVQRHRDVSDGDLPYRLAQRLLMAPGRCIHRACRRKTLHFWLLMRGMQLAPHLPAYPQQQDAAGEQQSDDLQELHRDGAKPMRSTVAANMPIRIAFLRCPSGRPAAASPMTIALSPASTRSIITTWKSAVRDSEENNSSMRATPLKVQSDIAVRLNCQRGPGLDAHVRKRRSRAAEKWIR